MTVEYTIPGMRVREHLVDVPLDWSDPSRGTIQVFVRDLAAPTRAARTCPASSICRAAPAARGRALWTTAAGSARR